MTKTSTNIPFFKMPGATFLTAYMLVFPFLFVITLLYSREETHIAINAVHNGFLDFLMKYWTHLGDGLFVSIAVIALLLLSFRHFFTGLAAFAFGGLTAQLLKHIAFSSFPRPAKFFELNDIAYQLYLVPGVEVNGWFSFPSGHTSTAFSFFFAMALFSKSRIVQALFFILALGVGYSRIYLSQHFLMDVVAGSFLGMATGWLAWRWFQLYDKKWLNSPAITIFKSRKQPFPIL